MATSSPEELSCPICPFSDTDEYILNLHIEEIHYGNNGVLLNTPTQTQGAFAACEPGESDSEFVGCPEEGCDEGVLKANLQEHLDFHVAERLSLDDHRESDYVDPLDFERSDGQEPLGLSRWAHLGSQIRRLGKSDLGPHAFEERMPDSVRKLVLDSSRAKTTQQIGADGRLIQLASVPNEVSGLIPLLATLLEEDANVKEAWLCHECVQHVHKTSREGSFCGYRNIQMLLSYVLATSDLSKALSQRHELDHVKGHSALPDILKLQDMIESAWDKGYNSHGRIETGGIKGTRKYIGTPEIYALCQYLELDCQTHDLSSDADTRQSSSKLGKPAHVQLYDQVENYFKQRSGTRNGRQQHNLGLGNTSAPADTATVKTPSNQPRIHSTALPPVYLQQPGHSMTIIGLEIRHDGNRNLLVFDPSFGPNKELQKMLQARVEASSETSPRKQTLSNHTMHSISQSTSSKRKRQDEDDSHVMVTGSRAQIRSLKDSKTSSAVQGGRSRRDTMAEEKASKLLVQYRRGAKHLSRYKEFEILMLCSDDMGS